MEKFKDIVKHKKLVIILSIPIVIVAQYYLFKIGILRPMIKGVEIQVASGDHIHEIDKYVMKLDETITLSPGEYIMFPSYSKEPSMTFKVLDDNNILQIEDGNKVVALQEGYSSVGIMKNSRVIKKATIKVVDPQVEAFEIFTGEKISRVGQKTELFTEFEVDYKEFEDDFEIIYESSNEEVLKVEDNMIEAVGVGSAHVTAKVDGQVAETDTFVIEPIIEGIDIDRHIEIYEGETIKLNPKIVTYPRNEKHPKVEYELSSKVPDVTRHISLNPKTGEVEGIRPGKEKVKITCGDKTVEVTIEVKERDISELRVENLSLHHSVIDNKVFVSLMFDKLEDIEEYEIHARNLSLGEAEFTILDSSELKIDIVDNKVTINLEYDLIEGKIPTIEFKVRGKKDNKYTKFSETKTLEEIEGSLADLKVENLTYSVDENTKTISLNWDSINWPDVTYIVYVKDNINGSGFIYKDKGIKENSFDFEYEGEEIDLDVYVVASDGKNISQNSNIVNIKVKLDEEQEDVEN